MAMSRKHFKELADMLARWRKVHGEAVPLDEVVDELASFCSQHNGNFDRGRFLSAANYRGESDGG